MVVGWELRLRPAERRVRLAVADALAVAQAPGQQVAPARVDVVAACKAARAEVQAAPAFGGDDSFRQATLSWIGAVEADHADADGVVGAGGRPVDRETQGRGGGESGAGGA